MKGGTAWARKGRWILPENARLPRNIQGSFTFRISTALLPFRREACWGFFFALKNKTASAGFEPANLGTKDQHATSRPPKPLVPTLTYVKCWGTHKSYRSSVHVGQPHGLVSSGSERYSVCLTLCAIIRRLPSPPPFLGYWIMDNSYLLLGSVWSTCKSEFYKNRPSD